MPTRKWDGAEKLVKHTRSLQTLTFQKPLIIIQPAIHIMTVPKYVKKSNGVHAYNPAWKPATGGADQEIQLPPFQNQATALPVVSAPMEDDKYHYFPEDEEIVIAPSYQVAVADYTQMVEDQEIVVNGTGGSADLLHDLNHVFAKYEVPAGMLSKLLLLKNFEIGEIIVDDSGSMSAYTDAKGPKGEIITRWVEAKYNIFRMFEVMAYVIVPVFYVKFLNRQVVLEFKKESGETPDSYIARVKRELEEVFIHSPAGTTPARERIQESLGRYTGQRVLRYFLGDGVPNGGPQACRQIEQLLLHRANPADNPFTFISCTNEDSAVEWMKECEEIAPFCSEFDDFSDESREILRDQGKAFPYSFGLHLVGQLVAAFCPHDLDAMDESVPFTKQTLDSLLGYQSSPQEYRYYFDSFLEAQRKLYSRATYENALERNFALGDLPALYSAFLSSALANDIPKVQQYKQSLKNRRVQQQRNGGRATYGGGGYNARGGPPPQDECCTIL